MTHFFILYLLAVCLKSIKTALQMGNTQQLSVILLTSWAGGSD